MENKISNRYAQAFFDFTLEKDCLEESYKDMLLLEQIFSENRDLKRAINSPMIKNSKKFSILKAVFDNKISDLTLRYVEIITMKNRENYIIDIAMAYVGLYKTYNRIFRVDIHTATALDKKVKDNFVKILEEQTKSTIELYNIIDPKIIGGFLLRMDDKQYDASILRKMRKLEREFSINIYESKL